MKVKLEVILFPNTNTYGSSVFLVEENMGERYSYLVGWIRKAEIDIGIPAYEIKINKPEILARVLTGTITLKKLVEAEDTFFKEGKN